MENSERAMQNLSPTHTPKEAKLCESMNLKTTYDVCEDLILGGFLVLNMEILMPGVHKLHTVLLKNTLK